MRTVVEGRCSLFTLSTYMFNVLLGSLIFVPRWYDSVSFPHTLHPLRQLGMSLRTVLLFDTSMLHKVLSVGVSLVQLFQMQRRGLFSLQCEIIDVLRSLQPVLFLNKRNSRSCAHVRQGSARCQLRKSGYLSSSEHARDLFRSTCPNICRASVRLRLHSTEKLRHTAEPFSSKESFKNGFTICCVCSEKR